MDTELVKLKALRLMNHVFAGIWGFTCDCGSKVFVENPEDSEIQCPGCKQNHIKIQAHLDQDQGIWGIIKFSDKSCDLVDKDQRIIETFTPSLWSLADSIENKRRSEILV
jgi:hypothetical protein